MESFKGYSEIEEMQAEGRKKEEKMFEQMEEGN